MTSLQWVATEMRTGNVIADLPDLDGDNSSPITLVQTMGRYETVTAGLPLPTAPENWQRATLQGATTLVLLQDDAPIWGAFVTRRGRTAEDMLSLSLMTMEGYLNRRYVGDVTFTGTGQNSSLQTVVSSYITAGPNGGIPLRIQVVNGGAGKLRDRQFFDKDDKTVYSVFQDLAGIIDGPEWTIGWERLTSPERYTPVLYVGDRVGSPVTSGLMPNAVFDIPGSISSFDFGEDHGEGKGANDVMAFSSGQGDARPQSAHVITSDPERPTYEYRYSPSTSTTDVGTLDNHAQGRAPLLFGGTTSSALTAAISDAPRFGVDWVLGDDVGYQVGGINQDGKETVPGFPGGITGVVRAVGVQFELSPTPMITPVIAGPNLEATDD